METDKMKYPGRKYKEYDLLPGDKIKYEGEAATVLAPDDPRVLAESVPSGDPDKWVYLHFTESGDVGGKKFLCLWTVVQRIRGNLVAKPDILRHSDMSVCPLCGYQGDDIIFAFCCSNQTCRNYRD
jgi:hypothetical protein